MIRQNIGAEKYDRVPTILWSIFWTVITIYTAFAAIMFFFPDRIFSLFTNKASVIAVSFEYVPIAVLTFFGFAFRSPMNALFNGCGNYKMNFLVALLDALLLRIGRSLLLGLACHMRYMGFWYGDVLAGFTPLVLGLIFLASGKWKTRKYVIKDEQ